MSHSSRCRLRPIERDRRSDSDGDGHARRLGAQDGERVAGAFIALHVRTDCSSITYSARAMRGVKSVPRSRTEQRRATSARLNRSRPTTRGDRPGRDDVQTTLVSRPERIDQVMRICEPCDLGCHRLLKTRTWLFDRDRRSRSSPSREAVSDRHSWTPDAEQRPAPAVLRHVGSTIGRRYPVRIRLRPAALRRARRHTSAGMVMPGTRQLDAIRRFSTGRRVKAREGQSGRTYLPSALATRVQRLASPSAGWYGR